MAWDLGALVANKVVHDALTMHVQKVMSNLMLFMYVMKAGGRRDLSFLS